MNLSAPFILRPIMTTLLLVTILALGISAYIKLPVTRLPDVNFPTITVTANYPGANPQTMATTVATPLEKQFMTIPGIKYVTSSNTLGSTSILLTFDITKNIDLAAVDVEAAIVAAKPQLPPNLPQDPIFKKVNPSATPIMYIVVTSPTMTYGELYDYANTFIGQRISIIEGVAQINVFGSPFAVRTQIDPGQTASFGLSLENVASAIADSNQYQPLGQFDGKYSAPLIYDNGGLYKANDYKPVIVAFRNGSPVMLQDVGEVVDSLKNDRGLRMYLDKNINQPCAAFAVLPQPGTNVVKVAKAIKELLPNLEKQLPGSLQILILFDRSASIVASIEDLQFTLLVAFILVVLVIYVYLGKWHDTIIPSLVMPMSVIATFAVIYPIGYTLDTLSLLALTLAIGFIIDDAIVVLENIVRYVETGETPYQASLLGSKQISFTIVSMTLSLVAVFIPLIFMAGLIGKLFQEFAITLTIVTVISGLISLSLTPMLCSRFIPSRGEDEIGRMQTISKNINTWMLKHYKRSLRWVLHHKSIMFTIGIVSVALSAYLFKILPTDFIPDEDIGFAIAYTESEQGTSSEQMKLYQQEVVEILKQEPSIAAITSIVASPVYRKGTILLNFIPRSQRKPISELLQELTKKVRKIPGVNVYLKVIPSIDLNIGQEVRGSYQYLMQSLDPQALYEAAGTLIEKMRSDPFFQGVSTDLEVKTPQLNLKILRDQAYALGVDIARIESALGLSFSGNRISRIQTQIDQYDVIMELQRKLQKDPSSLNYIYVRSNTTNQMVPLSALAEWKEGVGPASINHFAQFPAVTITFNVAPNVPLSDALGKLRAYARESFSAFVSGEVSGAAKTFEESIRSVSVLLIITIFTIYIILGILYESFVHPLTILSTLPPAIVGALLTLYITGMPLSLYAYLGIILLVGIVKKNGIMMVDFALDNIRTKGESPEKSIYDACIVRFRPIMMTTVAAIMGAVPIAFGIGSGAEALRPLGYVIIGGMCVSQLITLFLTPVIYLYMEQIRERFVRKV